MTDVQQLIAYGAPVLLGLVGIAASWVWATVARLKLDREVVANKYLKICDIAGGLAGEVNDLKAENARLKAALEDKDYQS